MAKNLNFLEKNVNEVDGSTSEEKEDLSNPSTKPMVVMTTYFCCGFQPINLVPWLIWINVHGVFC